MIRFVSQVVPHVCMVTSTADLKTCTVADVVIMNCKAFALGYIYNQMRAWRKHKSFDLIIVDEGHKHTTDIIELAINLDHAKLLLLTTKPLARVNFLLSTDNASGSGTAPVI